MLVGTTTTVTGMPRVRFPAFEKAVRRRAARGSRTTVVQISVLRRDSGEAVVLAHWELRNPDPSEAWERADEVVWRSLLELGVHDVEVLTLLDP